MFDHLAPTERAALAAEVELLVRDFGGAGDPASLEAMAVCLEQFPYPAAPVRERGRLWAILLRRKVLALRTQLVVRSPSPCLDAAVGPEHAASGG